MFPRGEDKKKEEEMAVDRSRLRAALKDANPSGGARHPYVSVAQEGRLRVEEVRTVDSKDPKKPRGTQFTHVVYTLLETSEEESLRVGKKYTWTNNNSDQNFGIDRVVQLVLAAHGEDPESFEMPDEKDPAFEELEKLIDNSMNGEALVGLEVDFSTSIITTNAGKPYTVYTFTPVQEAA